MSLRSERIKKAVFESPYVFYFIIIIFLYLGVNIWVNKIYVTAPTLFTTYRLSFAIPYLLFNLFIALLVALNINLAIIKIREYKEINKASGFTAIGIFGGILSGACPGCFVGLFPAFVGLFGVSATLGNLPFYGLEIQALSIVLLIIGAVLLSRETVCKIDYSKSKKIDKKNNKKKK